MAARTCGSLPRLSATAGAKFTRSVGNSDQAAAAARRSPQATTEPSGHRVQHVADGSAPRLLLLFMLQHVLQQRLQRSARTLG